MEMRVCVFTGKLWLWPLWLLYCRFHSSVQVWQLCRPSCLWLWLHPRQERHANTECPDDCNRRISIHRWIVGLRRETVWYASVKSRKTDKNICKTLFTVIYNMYLTSSCSVSGAKPIQLLYRCTWLPYEIEHNPSNLQCLNDYLWRKRPDMCYSFFQASNLTARNTDREVWQTLTTVSWLIPTDLEVKLQERALQNF